MAKDAEFYTLFDDVYAVKFPYAVVTDRTLSMAIPSKFFREIAEHGQQVKFAKETIETAGSKRADCLEIGKCFPAEVAILSGQLKEKSLKDYVIFKIK